jgi:putative tryptophan/tyrosine transport system substrate-binding protein
MTIERRRREFLVMLGGASVAWPLAARAQQQERMRRVGVLLGTAENDPETKRRVEALQQGLLEAGWIEGKNIRFEYRFSGGGDPGRMQRFALEVVSVAPDVIVVHSNDFLAALRQTGSIIPTVFAQVGDPVGSGFVESLAHPGGNLTGFTTFESDIGGKWLQTLKEIAPWTTQALVLLDPNIAANLTYLSAAEAAATKVGMRVTAGEIREASQFEPVIAAFASRPHGGLVVLPSPMTGANRETIIAIAAKYHLPAIYAFRFFAVSGGLSSYGVDTADLYRRAASYVDRILKGTKPADLPIQQPTKYELAINQKTAKTLGLEVPAEMLVRADEVIE